MPRRLQIVFKDVSYVSHPEMKTVATLRSSVLFLWNFLLLCFINY